MQRVDLFKAGSAECTSQAGLEPAVPSTDGDSPLRKSRRVFSTCAIDDRASSCEDLPPDAPTCRDVIRFRLSDDSGYLCFEAFEIVNSPECRQFEAALKEYLIGRPLATVDVRYLKSLKCNAECECVSAIIREVEKQQRMFGKMTEHGPGC
jgi:hypothetical protein